MVFAVALGTKTELLGNGVAVVVHSWMAGAAVVVYVLFVSFVSFTSFVVLVALPVADTLPAADGALVKLFIRGGGGGGCTGSCRVVAESSSALYFGLHLPVK